MASRLIVFLALVFATVPHAATSPDTLYAQLHSPDERVRSETLRKLNEPDFADPYLAQAVARLALDDPEEMDRVGAYFTLEKVRPAADAALPIVLDALRSKEPARKIAA